MSYVNSINLHGTDNYAIGGFGQVYINEQYATEEKVINFNSFNGLPDEDLIFTVVFKNGHTSTTDTPMTLNGCNIVYKDGDNYSNIKRYRITPNITTHTNIYTTLQNNTILNLCRKRINNNDVFVIIGNPIVYRGLGDYGDFEIYSNGTIKDNEIVKKFIASTSIHANNLIYVSGYGTLKKGTKIKYVGNLPRDGVYYRLAIEWRDRLNNNAYNGKSVKILSNGNLIDYNAYSIYEPVENSSVYEEWSDDVSVFEFTFDGTQWILNGDTLIGSYTQKGNDGELTCYNIYADSYVEQFGVRVPNANRKIVYLDVGYHGNIYNTFVLGDWAKNSNVNSDYGTAINSKTFRSMDLTIQSSNVNVMYKTMGYYANLNP